MQFKLFNKLLEMDMKNIDSLEKLLRLCLTAQEHEFLIKYKVFMHELEVGIRAPKTDEQINFVNSLKSGHQPKTEFEKIWFRYKALKNYYEEVSANEATLKNELQRKSSELHSARPDDSQRNSNLISILRQQVHSEKSLRQILEKRLEELGYSESVERQLNSNESFTYVCNACGSTSPNLCRCSE